MSRGPGGDALTAGRDAADAEAGGAAVGLTTADGVVVATDMRASRGGAVSHRNVQKVEAVHPTAVVTLVGDVGPAQSFVRNLRAAANRYEARHGHPMGMETLATRAGDIVRGDRFAVSPILAGVDPDGDAGADRARHHVYSLTPDGGVLADEYAAAGSGTQYALGVLEAAYEPGLSNDDAVRVAVRAVRGAVERDPASGDGVYVAEVTADGVDVHGHEDFEDVLA